MIHRGSSNNGVYPLVVPSTRSSSSPAFKSIKLHSFTWHTKLGNPAIKTLNFILKSIHVSNSSFFSCSYCDGSKIYRQSLNLSNTTTTLPLELVHIDAWGPFASPTVSGFQYYLIIMGDFSMFSWLFLNKYKLEVYSFFFCRFKT